MRWTVLLLTGFLSLGGAVAGLLSARAQQSASVTPIIGMLPDDADGPHHMLGWRHGPAPALGLVYDAPDKQLSAADVQKIAEAFLLWHGNHAWRVTSLVADGDRVTFAIANEQNAVIATFAMNRHSGTLSRTG